MSRAVQKHNKWDSTFDSCCHLSIEAVAPKARINSLIGFCSKSSSEPGTIGRPISQLGFRAFFNLGNFFARGPRSLCAIEGQRGIWDCNRVGLGLVYSLNDEDDDKSSMRAIRFSENKNIIFGPQMRTNATSSCVPISPKYVRPLGLLRFPVNFSILHIDDSINSCFSCKKKLQGEGIHIYRGERAFCSYNCRDRDCDRELWIEEEEMENPMVSALDSQGLSFLEDMFLARITVAT